MLGRPWTGPTHMIFVSLGTFAPQLLPPWPSDNLTLWLSVAEGALLPLLLLLTDTPFRRAAAGACGRGSGGRKTDEGAGVNHRRSFQDVDAPFRLFHKEESKGFPLTNGSLFPSLFSLPVDVSGGGAFGHHYKKDLSLALRMGLTPGGLRGLDLRRLGGGGGGGPTPPQRRYGAPYYCRDTVNSLGSASNDPLYADPTNKTSSVDSSLKEDHIYATLSETFGSMSSFGDGYLNDDTRCPSVTTVANDDFEFHDPRCSGCSTDQHHQHPLGRKACTRQQSCSGSSFSECSGIPSFGMRIRDDDTLVLNSPRNLVMQRPPADLPPEAYTSIQVVAPDNKMDRSALYRTDSNFIMEKNRQNIINCIKEEPVTVDSSSKIEYDNMIFDSDTLEKKYYMEEHAADTLERTRIEENVKRKEWISQNDVLDGTLSRKHRGSSLSMNDLDKFDKQKASDPEEQMMFLLPVKSESMLSLYRLYLAEDEQDSTASLHYSIELSKSENDLSVVNEEQEIMSIGRSSEDIHQQHHEIYQKRRRPQSSANKILRQHKIQRAKGVHMKSKPQLNQISFAQPYHCSPVVIDVSQNRSPHHAAPLSASAPTSPSTDGPGKSPYFTDGVQVAILDKSRRQNGIITIRDPSGLSVQELLSVLDRAGGLSHNNSKANNIGCSLQSTDANSVTTIPIVDKYRYMEPTSLPCAPSVQTTDFKKIFVSEYL